MGIKNTHAYPMADMSLIHYQQHRAEAVLTADAARKARNYSLIFYRKL